MKHEPPLCPACKIPMVLKPGYYGSFYSCPAFPACTYSVGTHSDGRPLGTPADAQTRKVRTQAHQALDRLWKKPTGIMKRPTAYAWLAKRLEIPYDQCHIGLFDLETCRTVIALCREQEPYLKQKETLTHDGSER